MDAEENNNANDLIITLTADVVAAHVSNNSVAVGDVATLIANVHSALTGLSTPAEAPVEKQEPAISIRSSVKPDYIVCLEDGKKLKMLKRYLMSRFQMTPDEYRAKWGLSADYPMTAPNYAQQRKELAVKIGLGKAGKGRKAATPKAPDKKAVKATAE